MNGHHLRIIQFVKRVGSPAQFQGEGQWPAPLYGGSGHSFADL